MTDTLEQLGHSGHPLLLGRGGCHIDHLLESFVQGHFGAFQALLVVLQPKEGILGNIRKGVEDKTPHREQKEVLHETEKLLPSRRRARPERHLRSCRLYITLSHPSFGGFTVLCKAYTHIKEQEILSGKEVEKEIQAYLNPAP